MSEFYSSPEDIRLGEEHYIRHLAGIAIIHNPIETRHIHGQEIEQREDALEPVVFQAEKLIYEGLKNVIRCANHPEVRGNMNKMEGTYQEALPNMLSIMASAYDRQSRRIASINQGFDALRPLIIKEENVYRQTCHGRLGKLKTSRLMDGVTIHDWVLRTTGDRDLTHLRQG